MALNVGGGSDGVLSAVLRRLGLKLQSTRRTNADGSKGPRSYTFVYEDFVAGRP